MKKYLLIIIFILCLTFNAFKAYNAESCNNEIILNDVNSKNLLKYIEENNLIEQIDLVCSSDICMKINSSTINRDIKSFINKNLNYLKNKVDDNTYLNLELKGFKIDKIITNQCP